MKDKICLITGATSGIGLATALGLAQQGATVVLVARNASRGADALARIRAETGSAAAQFLAADLSAQAEVRRLATAFQARYPRLDVLINNAGGFFHTRQESIDGIEMTWALNVLAPFVLTHLLLPTLEASAPARIVNVSSAMHWVARLDMADLESLRRNWVVEAERTDGAAATGRKQRYCRVQAYARSKLAILLITYEHARRLGGTGVTSNALDPGFVATNIISQNAGRQWRLIQAVLNLGAASPQEGARTALYLASSQDVAGTTGQYFRRGKPAHSSPASYDQVRARRLWEMCKEMAAAPPA
jgi:NAD(P)-dependent dehydrogenase (short-subunit alcohol dehydrogenase family)